MYFKAQYRVPMVELSRQLGPVEFDFGGPHQLTVTLQRPEDSTIAASPDHLVSACICRGTYHTNKKVQAIFEQLLTNRLPDGVRHPDDLIERVDKAGNITPGHVLPMEVFPEQFKDFVQAAGDELRTLAHRVVDIIRWRVGGWGPHEPLVPGPFPIEWSLDTVRWEPIPSSISVEPGFHTYIAAMPAELRSEITQLAAGSERAALPMPPLGHELFREAWEQRHQNPRSALVIGVAAAELGVKECIAQLLPESLWLLENLPAPPIYRIVAEYLPRLLADQAHNIRLLTPSDQLVKDVRNAVNARNTLVHAPRSDAQSERKLRLELRGHLGRVLDLLWLLDWYKGYSWAVDYVSQRTREELGLPEPAHRRPGWQW